MTPIYRWNPLQIDWGITDRQPPEMQSAGEYPISVQVQNTGASPWLCAGGTQFKLGYRWQCTYRDLDRTFTEEQPSANRAAVCDLAPGAAQTVDLTINDLPATGDTGALSLRCDIYTTTSKFSTSGNWPEYSQNIRLCPTTGCVRQARTFDLTFVIDTTGSMDDDIAAVKASATQIVTTIAGSGDDYRVAVVDFRDFPVAPYGRTGDYPSRIALNFSTDPTAISNAINGLTIGNGDDWPESVYSGLMAGINLTWRAGAEKVIILMGDAPPHDPEPTTGYTSASVTAAASAGGTSIQAELAALASAAATNGTPIHVHPILIGDDADALAAFQQLAAGTGGTLFQAAAASDVTGAVLDAINSAVAAPTADAGGPYSAIPDAPITFDAIGSFDPDGVIETYEWDFDGDGVFDSSIWMTTAFRSEGAFHGTPLRCGTLIFDELLGNASRSPL
jgi:hypothetical protein